MKFIKPPKLHLYSFIISMPLITFTYMYIMYGQRVWADWKPWVISWPIIYFIGYFSWYGHVQYDHYLQQKYPSLQQTGRRVTFKLLVNLLVMTPSVVIIFFVFQGFNVLNYQVQLNDLQYGYLLGLSVNLIFTTMWEVIYIIEKYRESLAEKEVLEQLQLHQEFEVLKQKVNPHFLFNCFNTLSSLISENRDRAEVFLDELSKVYRYLLRNNEDSISTLDSEMAFIQSYFQLLKTRHGDAVFMQMEIDKQYRKYLLPSLSLQMLVENVVKHNSLSKNHPLTIEIFTTVGNKLVVSNNLQRRVAKAPGGNVGLDNIKAKYELLNQPGFQVVEDEKNFMVVLPLIWNNNMDHKKPVAIEQRNA
ncbi:MAG: histidine kinase [Bacteroidota bacterium]